MQSTRSRWQRLAWVGAAQVLCIGLAPAQDRTYTTDADFDEGNLVNVNHDAPFNDQLQLNFETQPFPFVNVAVSDRGTVVRIDVNTGEVLGEYSTNPDAEGPTSFPNPSRTTVDKYGNVWVANRGEDTLIEGAHYGSVMRYGLVVGGTRVDAEGIPDPLGQYLAPPFEYSTAVDRDGDGLIKTSRGLGDILPWSNAGGADTYGGVSTAEDECIMNYVLTPGTGTRTVAVDDDNDVWVGCMFGADTHTHVKIDVTGPDAVLDPSTQFNLACGGYGGFIDGNGVLWSSGRGSGLLRYDTNLMAGANLGTAMGDYGLGLDPNTGDVWHSSIYGPQVHQIDPNGVLVQSLDQPLDAQGVAVDSQGHVWVAELFGTHVMHYAPDPLSPGGYVLVGYVFGLQGSTGVAIDANGKVWVSEQNSSETRGAARIDPLAGNLGTAGIPIGAIDLTVGLGVGGNPYNYSDMTGFVLLSAIQEGSWTVVHDTGTPGTSGERLFWTSAEPAGTAITVEARAADALIDLSSEAFVPVTQGIEPGLVGRYVEVQATFSRQLGAAFADLTPVLFDLTIEVNAPPVAKCKNTRLIADGDCMADGTIDDGSYDPDGGPLQYLLVPAGPYPLGLTSVTLYVTDEQGLTDSCSALVHVVDKQGPDVIVGPTKFLWPPDHSYRFFDLADLVALVQDDCAGQLGICTNLAIRWVGSDELEDAYGSADGTSMDDILILGPRAVALRSERMDCGNGRVYTVCFDAWDDVGNISTWTVQVCVPRERGGHRPVDDTPAMGYVVMP